jgi:RNA polymerase sigma-70 factor (ECF subfamily)
VEIAAMMETDRFQALYDANQHRVRGLLARIVGPQEAEDLAQVVFTKAAEALPTFRGEAQVSTWLHRIALNVASDWLRSRSAHDAKVTVQLPDGFDEQASELASATAAVESQTSPERELARKDLRDCIRAEIGQLSPDHQAVLLLGELGGLTDDEVAETLGITRGNAKVRLHRARQELKKAIGARCDFYRHELSCAPTSPTCCPPATPPDGAKPVR